jgi:hypothetical protein
MKPLDLLKNTDFSEDVSVRIILGGKIDVYLAWDMSLILEKKKSVGNYMRIREGTLQHA